MSKAATINTEGWGDTMAPAGFPSRWIPHEPEPPQQAFMWLECLEAMYGGAAGGGKSDALLAAALQYVDVPNYAALLIRKTYGELSQPGGLIDLSKQWLASTPAKWNDNEKMWSFPSGATLSFGYLKAPNDKYRYQGSSFQFIGFDELTQFSKRDYLYLMSRLRRLEGFPVPVRMRAASNPGGVGNAWVKKRFIDKKDEDQLPGERIFIPAKLGDNPHLDQDLYRIALQQLDEHTRAQLLDGDWEAREPGDWMIPDSTWVDAAVELAEELLSNPREFPEPAKSVHGRGISICIDWGEFTHAYSIWPLESGGVYVLPSEVINRHGDPAQVTPEIIYAATKFGYPITDARYDAAGIQSMRTFINVARAMEGTGTEKLKSTKIAFSKYKRLTINYLRLLFRRTAEGYDTFVIAIHPENTELIRQLKRWERKDEESDEAVKHDDHGPDALVAGVAPIAEKHQSKVAEIIKEAHQNNREEALAA